VAVGSVALSVEQMSLFTALLALVALAVTVGLVALGATAGGRRRIRGLRADMMRLAFSVVAVSTAGSLWFSEVGDFVPCQLCWFQRIAMYPLVVVLGVAVWRGDPDPRWRVLPFSVVGLLVSAYHYQLQLFPDQGSSCDVTAPCTQRWVEEFGFVSIPFMALCGFAAVTTLVLAAGAEDRDTMPSTREDARP
jgi:disulfide bond formation protein DsbB